MPTIRSGFLSTTSLLVLLGVSACGGSVTDGSNGKGSGGTGGSGTGGMGTGGSSGGDGGWAGGTGSTGGCAGEQCGCMYEGQFYPIGAKFPSIDKCNSCTCETPTVVSCTNMACTAPGCDYNGKHYNAFESFPAGDGCNTCTCGQDGQIACTGAYCEPICTYAGKPYSIGQQFPSLDGCNTCICTDQGISCTEINCPCNPEKEWWRSYVATDPAKCALIDYACIENTKPFQNACGCGCEQDPSCPEYFDCMPPSPCNPEEIKKKCPYSKIAY